MFGVLVLALVLFVLAYILWLVPDVVLMAVSWLLAVLQSALAPLGIAIPDYLSSLVPNFLTLSQIVAFGMAVAAVLIVVFSILEE